MTMKPFCCANKELTQEFAAMAKFLRIIGEDNRLKILCILKDGEKCVCELVASLDLSQTLISNHLKALRDLGLIEGRQEWKKTYYSINKKAFKKYDSQLTNFLKNYE